MTDATTNGTNGNKGDLKALVAKIEKLMALADGNANEHEAAAAAARVQALMQSYNLEIEDLNRLRGEKAQHQEVRIVHVPFLGLKGKGVVNQRTSWEVDLASCIAANNFCRALFTKVSVVLVGTEANLEACAYVYAQLTARLWALSAQERNTYVRKTQAMYKARGEVINPDYQTNKMGAYDPYVLKGGDNPNAFRRSWLEGAVMGVAAKLYEQKRAFEQATSGQGTQLSLNHDARNQAFIDETINKGKKPKPFTMRDQETNYTAKNAGYEAGKALNIHAGLGGDTREAPALKETKRING